MDQSKRRKRPKKKKISGGEEEESYYSRPEKETEENEKTVDYWKDDDGFKKNKGEEGEGNRDEEEGNVSKEEGEKKSNSGWEDDEHTDKEPTENNWDNWENSEEEESEDITVKKKERKRKMMMIEEEEQKEDYIKISDIVKNEDYTVYYIDKVGEIFEKSKEKLANVEIVGIDTEFEQNKGARYIQISTETEGFVFNMHKLRFKEEVRTFFMGFFGDEKIKKIGFAVSNDIDAIKRAFQNRKQFKMEGFESLEEILFMARTSNSLGLSDLCNRLYSKIII